MVLSKKKKTIMFIKEVLKKVLKLKEKKIWKQ
jgi:hypothetical protein